MKYIDYTESLLDGQYQPIQVKEYSRDKEYRRRYQVIYRWQQRYKELLEKGYTEEQAKESIAIRFRDNEPYRKDVLDSL